MEKVASGMIKLFKYILLFSLFSCGDNSPFDEDYWDEPGTGDQQERESEVKNYTATLVPLTPRLGSLKGSYSITITDTQAQSQLSLTELPQTLIQTQQTFTSQSCESLLNQPFPEIPNPNIDFKDISSTETWTRDALAAELNQSLPENGGSMDLSNRRVLINFYIRTSTTSGTQNVSVLPLACGNLVAAKDQDGDTGELPDTTTQGGVTGGGTTVGGTTGDIGGTIGTGVAGGTTAGTTTGTTAGTASGTAGF